MLTETQQEIGSSIGYRRDFFERVLYHLLPRGYVSMHFGENNEILQISNEDKSLQLTVNYTHRPIMIDPSSLVLKEGTDVEQPVFFSVRSRHNLVPSYLKDIFIKYKYESKLSFRGVWFSDEETLKLTDPEEAADKIDSRFSEFLESIDMDFLKMIIPPVEEPSIGISYHHLPNHTETYTEFYKNFSRSKAMHPYMEIELKEPFYGTSYCENIRTIEKLAAKYVKDSDKWTDINEYISFLDYFFNELDKSEKSYFLGFSGIHHEQEDKVDELLKSELLKYLRVHDGENLLTTAFKHDFEDNDMVFIRLLIGLHNYNIHPRILYSVQSNLTNIVTFRKLAELAAMEALKDPLSYAEQENPFGIFTYLFQNRFKNSEIHTHKNPYGQLLLRLADWSDFLHISGKRRKKIYNAVTKFLPEELVKSKDINELFLALLPANLRKHMEYLYEGTTPAIINSKLLSQQEKVNILLKLPGSADSEEEILPKLNLGMVKYDESKRMSPESLNNELLRLALHISPYLSREELVKFCSEKLTEIYLKRGFQVSKEKASKLMEELQAQLR